MAEYKENERNKAVLLVDYNVCILGAAPKVARGRKGSWPHCAHKTSTLSIKSLFAPSNQGTLITFVPTSLAELTARLSALFLECL